MITKKHTYRQLKLRRYEIAGMQRQVEGKIITDIVGLKYEDVSQGVAVRLNRILKKMEDEFSVLQKSLDEVKEEDPDREKKITDLWAEEIEISFEEVDIEKLDFKRKDNSHGQKYDYTELIDFICAE